MAVVVGVPEEKLFDNFVGQVTVLLDVGLAESPLLRRETRRVVSANVRTVRVATRCDLRVAD